MINIGLILFIFVAVAGSIKAETSNDICLTAPTTEECRDFVYPPSKANEDAAELCKAMPYMIGCTIQRMCSGSKARGIYCQDTSIVLDICLKDPRMSTMKGCELSKLLCSNKELDIKLCTANPGPLPGIIGTYAAMDAAETQCTDGTQPGCKYCTNNSECDEPLLAIIANCIADSTLEGCESWKKMCQQIPDGMQALCQLPQSSNSTNAPDGTNSTTSSNVPALPISTITPTIPPKDGKATEAPGKASSSSISSLNMFVSLLGFLTALFSIWK